MSRRVIRIASSCIVLGLFGNCTRLESANERFPAAMTGGASFSSSGGDAGVNGGSSGGEVAAAPGSAGAAGCVDARGFDGRGCYRCESSDLVTLENACTDASCVPFDNARRLSLLIEDGRLPDLPKSPAAAATVTGPSGGGSGVGGSGDLLAGAAGGAEAGSSGSGGDGGEGGTAGSAGSGAQAEPAASPRCDGLREPAAIVYVTGSSALKPFLEIVARQLTLSGVSLVYSATGSCAGVDAALNAKPMAGGAVYWDGVVSDPSPCSLPEPVTADIGVSDVFAQSCPGFELVNLDSLNVNDAHGPIQTMSFAVPSNSPFREISAEAAYFVFGFGAQGGVRDIDGATPIWGDEALILQRNATSGTQAMIAAAIGVPPKAFRGKPHKSSDELTASLQAASVDSSSAARAIGILAADYIETRDLRAQIRSLAFQDRRQACAVYPDSTATARDKQNVRDGHYPIWGPLHLLYRVDAAGNPRRAENRQQVLDVLGFLSGSKPLPNGVRLIDMYAQSGLVPECAMRVRRTQDGGNISPYRPPNPCSCLFEAAINGATACTSCAVQADCQGDEVCSLGYCER